MTSILYISYDGILEPLGQSQVLGYIEKLASDYSIYLISFEKKKDRRNKKKIDEMRKSLSNTNIHWIPLTYHKSPSILATTFDITIGIFVAMWLTLTKKIKIVHARSYVPALMSLFIKQTTGAKFLFDMRGFWADERTDGGLWKPDGKIYQITKKLERIFLLKADHVVTLTNASKKILTSLDYLQRRSPPITVIPTCANLDRFKAQNNAPSKEFIFGYVGSVGTWYLFDETLVFFKALLKRKPEAKLLVVNRNEHEIIRSSISKAGIDTKKLELVASEHSDVPTLVSRMDVAGAIIRPCFSKIASAPTKLAEYLGCGVPCVGNSGVGDIEEILEGEKVGIALRAFSDKEINLAVNRLLTLIDDPALSSRCVDTAHRLFSLETGVSSYRSIYKSLI